MEELAERLVAVLGLAHPPVALRFVTEKPAGVRTLVASVPSACSLWRKAETGTFYASAQRHHGCPVGTFVMGFPVDEVNEQLGAVMETMVACGYFSADEAGAIPTVREPAAGIVYGPLAETDRVPDVVLMWVTAKQAMLLGEASGSASWTADPTTTTGRPGCAVLPRAMNSNEPAMSLGCIGMRTFTGIPDHLMAVAVPGPVLAGFVATVERLAASNDSMRRVYNSMLESTVPNS